MQGHKRFPRPRSSPDSESGFAEAAVSEVFYTGFQRGWLRFPKPPAVGSSPTSCAMAHSSTGRASVSDTEGWRIVASCANQWLLFRIKPYPMIMNSDEILLLAWNKGYRIDSEGNVTNSKGKIVRGNVDARGYKVVGIAVSRDNLKKGSTVRFVGFHRLQAYKKYGEAIFDHSLHARHYDGNQLNNSWENIILGTASQNMMDIKKEVRTARSLRAASFTRSFTKEQVNRMREMRREGFTYLAIAKTFGSKSKGHIHQIITSNRFYQ